MPTRPPSRTLRNRRRFPRLQVLGLVEGFLVPLDVPLEIRELSQGGFSVHSASPFPPGSQHHFRFTTTTHEEVTIDATAVHCRLTQADAGGHVTYVTGFEFVSSQRTDEAVGVLIDTLTSVLSLD
jgi:PilZ domain